MKILVFGSLNIDRRYIVDHFVQPGETLSSLDVGTFSGGKGLNQAIACKKAGSDVYMAGKIGKDGAFLLAELKDADVSTKHVFIDEDMMSGHAIIQVDTNGQNCIITYGGTNRAITKEEIDEVLADFSAGDIILMQNEINSMEYIIEQAHAKGMLVALNPSPIDDALMNSDLSKVTYFIMNEVEAAKISGKADVTEAFDEAVTIQGTVCVNLKAALKDGNPETDFDPENRNDVDILTMQLGNSMISGRMDDVEIAVLLCDVCDEAFDSIQSVDPERNIM